MFHVKKFQMFSSIGLLQVVSYITCAVIIITVSCNESFAVTYDLTGTWNAVSTITSTNCVGFDPVGSTFYGSFQATQSGTMNTTESWSIVAVGESTKTGTVSGTSYSSTGSDPQKSWTLQFDILPGNTTATGTEILIRLDQNGPCQEIDSFTFTRSGASQTLITPDTPSNAIIVPQVLKTSTTNIVNLVSKRIRATISHRGLRLQKKTTALDMDNTLIQTSQIADNHNENIDNPVTPNNEITDIMKALHMEINSSDMGLSAGGSSQKMGVWGNVALSFSDNDQVLTASSIDVNTYVTGFDYKITDNLVTGFALTYDNTDATNSYNSGTLDASSWSVVPYISYLINDYLSIEALYGHSWVDTDQTRSNNTIISSPTSRRDFVSTSLNVYETLKDINYTGNMTYTWAKEVTEGFNELNNGTIVSTIASNNTKFSQFGLGLELSYLINQFEPYISLAYENDVTHTDFVGVVYDTEGGTAGLGVRMNIMDSLSGDLDYNQTINRDNLDEYTLSANVRYDF